MAARPGRPQFERGPGGRFVDANHGWMINVGGLVIAHKRRRELDGDALPNQV